MPSASSTQEITKGIRGFVGGTRIKAQILEQKIILAPLSAKVLGAVSQEMGRDQSYTSCIILS